MATYSNDNTIIYEPSRAHTRDSNVAELADYVKIDDLLKLSYSLLCESAGTRFQKTAGKIAKSWMNELKRKRDSQMTVNRFLKYMETVQPNYMLIISLAQKKRRFINLLFNMDTTLYILSDNNADNVIAISKSPTTTNILDYCSIYSDTLIDGCDYFWFMVHGENEIDEKGYRKITKGEWDAFSG